jgi:hypothetical protein
LIDQKQFSPKVNGGMGIDFVFSTKYGDKFAVLLSMNSGGNACPATYRWVLLNEKGFEASPDFGNCSEDAKGSLVGNELIVTVPKYGTPPYGVPGAKYIFNGVQLKENDKVTNGKITAGGYMVQEKVGPLSQPANSAADSIVAWCLGFLNTYSNVTANQPMDRNHANVFNKYGPRVADVYKRWKACMGNDSSEAKNAMCRKSLGPSDQEFWETNLIASSKAKEAFAEGGITRLKANVELKCGRLY